MYSGNLVIRRYCKLLVIINCYVYSIVGKKDELEIGIVIGFCLGNFREYNEVLLC